MSITLSATIAEAAVVEELKELWVLYYHFT